jgi:hypothetical protein
MVGLLVSVVAGSLQKHYTLDTPKLNRPFLA